MCREGAEAIPSQAAAPKPAVPHKAALAGSTTFTPDETVGMHAVRFDPATMKTLATVDETYSKERPDKTRVKTQVTADATGKTLAKTSVTVPSASMKLSGSFSDPLADMPAVEAPGTIHALASSSGGCCSDAGGWDLSWYLRYSGGGPLDVTTFHWHVKSTFCWGGGIAGVRWGSVYNCDYTPYSAQQPSHYGYFDAVNGWVISSARSNATVGQYYYGWANMNNAYHTEYYAFDQGAATGCVAKVGCVTTFYPSITIWEHANGEYDFSGS